MEKSKAERGRFSSRKKMDVALHVLRGEDLDLVSREAGITTLHIMSSPNVLRLAFRLRK